MSLPESGVQARVSRLCENIGGCFFAEGRFGAGDAGESAGIGCGGRFPMLGLCFPVSFVCRFAGRDGVRGAGTFGCRAGECRFFFVSLHKTPCCGRYYSCRADRRFLPLHLSDSNSGCLRRKKCRFFPECFSNAEEFAGVSCDQRISAIFFRAGPVPHFVRRRPRCGIAAVPCQQMLNTKNNSL